MPCYEFLIEPLDPLLFGDNRSARAGLDHLQRDQDPSPLTIHGALGRFLADRSESWPAGLLGPEQDDVLNPQSSVAELFGYSVQAEGTLYFPRPRHLRCTLSKGKLCPADLVTPGEDKSSKISLAWPKLLLPADEEPLGDEAEGDLLVSETALSDVLCGARPSSGILQPQGIFRAEPRPGIAVDNDAGTVFEGAFFTRPYRRFQSSGLGKAGASSAGFAAWLQTLAPIRLNAGDGIGFLGGDRRRVRFNFQETGPVALSVLCEEVARAAGEEESGGFLLYLLTPMLQPEAPVEVEGLRPIAAALGKPGSASGWDVKQRQPRPLRALVPAGSVYFFDWNVPPGPERAELVRRLWMHALRKEGAAAGFGRCLPGIWR